MGQRLIEDEDEDYLRARDISAEELEDMAEEDRAQIEERLEHLTIAQNIEDVRVEIAQLEGLIVRAERARTQEVESKLVGLRDHVLRNLGERKLPIFTEFRDTVDYLVNKLRTWGYQMVTIHGQMNMDARIAAIDATYAQDTLDRAFLSSLATRPIDYTGLLKETLLAEENRLVPEFKRPTFCGRTGGWVGRWNAGWTAPMVGSIER